MVTEGDEESGEHVQDYIKAYSIKYIDENN